MKRPLFPLQYEPEWVKDYVEEDVDKGAKLDCDNCPDLVAIRTQSKVMPLVTLLEWMNKPVTPFDATTHFVDLNISQWDDPRHKKPTAPCTIVLKRPLSATRHLRTLLNKASDSLPIGGYIWCNSQISGLKRERIYKKHPWGIRKLVYGCFYLWHRVFPKIAVTRRFYFWITKGKHRTFNRVEILGRLYRAGFEVVSEDFSYGTYYVIGRKVKQPIYNDQPSGAPIIKLRRVGKDGKNINIFKFRTMYAYSEYIQSYVYQHNDLQQGGKFANDYRVNFWGKLLRPVFLDELPMLINLLRGDIKLVGVRPLSRHYLSLYTPEMQQLRTSVKPGLMPPFYALDHTPRTLEEIQANEREYILAYQKHPFRTDWHYFWHILYNITFGRKKSH